MVVIVKKQKKELSRFFLFLPYHDHYHYHQLHIERLYAIDAKRPVM